MAGAIYFNGSELTGQHDVKLNGTNMDNVYLNGSKIWTRHPYTPGTEIFTYSWGSCNSGGNIDNLRTTYYSNYPLAFASQPSYSSGSGANDSTLSITLADGFYVSYYNQTQGGTDSDGVGASNTGGSYNVWVGQSVSGLARSSGSGSLSVGSSGNCGSTFKVTYSGQ